MASSQSATWQSEYPFASNYLQLERVRLHYVDEGNGHPILMVHGNPTWSFYYRHLIQSLSDNYRAIAVDHVGCGKSDKPSDFNYSLDNHIENLSTLISTLDLRNVTLVAHDWGGAIGLGALLNHRERFNRIILFNTGAFPPPYIPWRIRACRLPLLGKIGVQGLNLFARAAITMATTQSGGLPATTAGGLLAPYNSWSNRKAIYQFVKDIPTHPSQPTWQRLAKIEERLPELTEMKKLLIWGMKDWCFRPDCLDRFASHWADAEIEKIDSAGHYVVEDAQEQINQRVKTFLEQTAS